MVYIMPMQNNVTVTKYELEKILDWAREKTHSGSEPPWAFYQYMKLQEAIDYILKGMETTNPTVSLPQSVKRQGNVFQLSASTSLQDSAQHHQDIVEIHLPT